MPITTPALLLSEYNAYKKRDSVPVVFEPQFREAIEQATETIQARGSAYRRFDERIETRSYTPLSYHNGGHLDPNGDLRLDDDLLTVSEILNGDGSDITANVLLLPLNSTRHYGVRLNHDVAVWTEPSSINSFVDGSIQVTGTWGYGGTWRLLDNLNGDIDDSVTTVTVSDGTLFEIDMFLKVESEYLLVEDVNGNDLTVVRGHNGSTPAPHTGNPSVFRYHFDNLVKRAMVRLMAYVTAQDSSPFVGQAQIGDFNFPVDLTSYPADFRKIVKALARQSKSRSIRTVE